MSGGGEVMWISSENGRFALDDVPFPFPFPMYLKNVKKNLKKLVTATPLKLSIFAWNQSTVITHSKFLMSCG